MTERLVPFIQCYKYISSTLKTDILTILKVANDFSNWIKILFKLLFWEKQELIERYHGNKSAKDLFLHILAMTRKIFADVKVRCARLIKNHRSVISYPSLEITNSWERFKIWFRQWCSWLDREKKHYQDWLKTIVRNFQWRV